MVNKAAIKANPFAALANIKTPLMPMAKPMTKKPIVKAKAKKKVVKK